MASPSYNTLQRVLTPIDPDAFAARLAAWAGALAASFEREVAATDGRTVRQLFDHDLGQSSLYVVSAWAELASVPVTQRPQHQRSAARRALALG